MIAHLGMYDRAETARANDRLWAGVRQRLGYGPEVLTREGNFMDHWTSPDLLLSQTCGFPYRACLHDKVTLIATPDYGLEGCAPGYYQSVFVARADDPRRDLADFDGACLAYNEAMSQSGWAAPCNHLNRLGLKTGNLYCSGGHLESARAVADGKADFAALDALTWKLITRYDAFAADLRVIAATDPTPTLPFISAAGRDPHALFDALAEAVAGLSVDDRETLSICGIVKIPAQDYLAVPTPNAPQKEAHL